MKRIFFSLLFITICLTSYYDITKGTLNKQAINGKVTQTMTVNALPENSNKGQQTPIKNVKINPGDTVLSIVEKLNPKKHIAITKILTDFKQLNPQTDPNHIQIGKTYQFPLYENQNQARVSPNKH